MLSVTMVPRALPAAGQGMPDGLTASDVVSVRDVAQAEEGPTASPVAGDPGAARNGVAVRPGHHPASERVASLARRLIDRILEESNRRLRFRVHEATGRIWVQVIDGDSGQVIKEIPPERYLDLVARIWELAGLLVDERA